MAGTTGEHPAQAPAGSPPGGCTGVWPVPLEEGSPQLEPGFQSRGQENLPPPAGCTLPAAPQEAIGLVWPPQGTLLAPGPVVAQQHCQVLSPSCFLAGDVVLLCSSSSSLPAFVSLPLSLPCSSPPRGPPMALLCFAPHSCRQRLVWSNHLVPVLQSPQGSFAAACTQSLGRAPVWCFLEPLLFPPFLLAASSVDPNDQKKTACYDIDVEVDDTLKTQMNSFLLSTASQQEIAALDNKVGRAP